MFSVTFILGTKGSGGLHCLELQLFRTEFSLTVKYEFSYFPSFELSFLLEIPVVRKIILERCGMPSFEPLDNMEVDVCSLSLLGLIDVSLMVSVFFGDLIVDAKVLK